MKPTIVIIDKTLDQLIDIMDAGGSCTNPNWEWIADQIGNITPDIARCIYNQDFEGQDTVYQCHMPQADFAGNLSQMEANDIYSILVEEQGLSESNRAQFLHDHVAKENLSNAEWRMIEGKFGGKFFSVAHGYPYYVSYYQEHRTEETHMLENRINGLLIHIYAKYRLPNTTIFGDKELISYCEFHCEAPQPRFAGYHVNHMLHLAGYPENFRKVVDMTDFYVMDEEMKELVNLAKAKLAA